MKKMGRNSLFFKSKTIHHTKLFIKKCYETEELVLQKKQNIVRKSLTELFD